MGRISDAYRAAADAWTAAAELADLQEPTNRAVQHARVASQAAASGKVKVAQANAHQARATLNGH